jgi:hypothetical protein
VLTIYCPRVKHDALKAHMFFQEHCPQSHLHAGSSVNIECVRKVAVHFGYGT